MKPWLRIIIGATLALAAIGTARAQVLQPTAISASPSSALPGAQVSFSVTVSNSDTNTSFSGTLDFTVKITNTVTGSTYTFPVAAGISPDSGVISKATIDTTSGLITASTDTFTVTTNLPTKTLESGTYSAKVTISNPSTGSLGANTAFTTSSTVLTVTGSPDLQITGLTYPSGTSYTGGTVIPMTLSYRNNPSTGGTQNVPYTPGINGYADYVRIQVVLSTNPTFGDADDFQLTYIDVNALNLGVNQHDLVPAGTDDNGAGGAAVNADGNTHTFTWNQVLPGNFTGSYYVLAKIDTLNALPQNDPAALTVNGNNIWGGNTLNPAGTLINLVPSNFPTTYLATHASGSTSSSDGYSDNPSMSSDGRYVAFASDASDLVSGDTNSARDIFLFDAQTDLVRRLSLSQQGSQGNGASNNPAISAAGRYVAFESVANNLDTFNGDTNGFSDIFVVDVITGLISRVSGLNATGAQANGSSFKPAISSDGRYIVFQSTATNLVSGRTITPGVSHVYLFDRDVSGSGTFDTSGNTATYLVDMDSASPASATGIGGADAIQATISTDGSTIAFASKATNLVSPATTSGRQHVYVISRANVVAKSGGTVLVSVVDGTGAEGDADSQTPSLNSDGHYVAFASLATNLVSGDTNGVSDIFVYDTTQPVATPVVRRMSIANDGSQGVDPSPTSPSDQRLGSINPTISSDGRYVAFASLDANLTIGDSYGKHQGSGATATATVAGGAITAINVVTQGTGYSQAAPPVVVITDSSGAGASAVATVDTSGQVTGYTIVSGGSGYSGSPTVTIASDTNNSIDIFVHDREAGNTDPNGVGNTANYDTVSTATTMVSVNPFGYQTGSLLSTPSTPASNIYPVISANGRFVAFPSDAESTTGLAFGATNLLPTDSNTFRDIFLFDRRTNTTVTAPTPPSITITSPGTTSNVLVNSAISITATATTTTGVVSSVQFYVNGTSLGTSTDFPYSQTWTPTAVGVYTLSAIVTDSFGNVGVSANVFVTVVAAPSVGVTSPTSGSTLTFTTNANQTITAVAAASNPGATVVSVAFYANGALISTDDNGGVPVASGTFAIHNWSPAAAGTYLVTAIATDSLGTTATSAPVTIVWAASSSGVGGASPPDVVFTSPSAGATIPINTASTLSATVTPTASGATIASVIFSVRQGSSGSFVPIGAVTTATSGTTYSIGWTPVVSGSYTIQATATDSNGKQNDPTTSEIAVTVSAPPTIVFGTDVPADGAVIPVNIPLTLTATATQAADNVPITKVEYFIDGLSIGIAPVNSGTPALPAPPYTLTWSGQISIGKHVLTVVATDLNGSVSPLVPLDSQRNISIGTGTSNPLPSISITSPIDGTTSKVGVQLNLTATAQVGTGIVSSVRYYANGAELSQSPQVLDTNQTNPTLSSTFTPAATGDYIFTAVVTDSAGNRAVSAPVTVTVTDPNKPPTVSIGAPLATSSPIEIGKAVSFIASVDDSDGTVASVEFSDNGNVLRTFTTGPTPNTYTVPWIPTAGAHTLKVLVTDNEGAQSSAVVDVTAGTASGPTVAISAPLDGSALPVNVTQTITASATAATGAGTISNVQFYVNGVLIDTASIFPYQVTWTPRALGTYVLAAIATDTVGNQSASAPSTVTVTDPNSIPVVAITAPTSGAIVNGATTVTATASSPNGTIASVQFYANGASVGNGVFNATNNDYELSWTPVTRGINTLTAVATDSTSVKTTSTAVMVNYVVGTAPAITITNPTDGTTLQAGTLQTVAATATTTTGSIVSVQFSVDGTALAAPTASGSQYSTTWTPSVGSHQITALATDSTGNVGLATATVQATSGPLISVTGVTTESQTGTPGSSVALDVAVTNSAYTDVVTHSTTGDTIHTPTATPENQWNVGGTATFNVTFFDPKNGAVFFTQNGLVGSVTAAVPGLGGTGKIVLNMNVPASTTPAGTYKVTVTLVSVTGNGAGITPPLSFTTSDTVFTVSGKPDLAITGLTYTAGTAYQGGDVIPMSLTYTNLATAPDGTGNVPYQPNVTGNAAFFRIEVILSSNPKFGDADDFLLTFFDVSSTINADGANHAISWNQLLPGNFAGTYYVMAKIDTLNGVSEAVEDDLSRNGNNTWFDDTNAARITLLPTNFPTTYWASLDGNGYSDNPAVSGSGRYVAFASDSTNFVTTASAGGADTNGVRDIFLYDNQTLTVRRISLSSAGTQTNGASNNPAISSDGRFVAFASDATNLVANDTNGFSDIFVVDTLTGAVTRDSVSSASAQANGSNFKPALSSDGRYVVWESTATNLVASPTVTPGTSQIYLRDRTTGATVLVSQSTTGTVGNGNSLQATVSGDGKYVAFASDATNLVASDTNGVRDIFLRDLSTASPKTTRVSVSSAAVEADGPSHSPSINRNQGVTSGISADGRYIAFDSLATNLVTGDTNAVSDVFVYDRVAQTTVRVSVASSGAEGHDPSPAGQRLGSLNPSISATGRYVVFASLDDDLTAGDLAGEYSATDANDAVDIFTIDRDVSNSGAYDTAGNIATQLASVNRFGYQTLRLLGIPSTAASDLYPTISDDGRWVALPTDAENTAGLVHGLTNRTSPDSNGFRDVVLFDRRTNSVGASNPGFTLITTPLGAISLPQGSSTIFKAGTSGALGAIKSVQYYDNGTAYGSPLMQAPYAMVYEPMGAVGTAHNITAQATDYNGAVLSLSAPVTITVIAAVTPLPTVTINNPIANSTLPIPNYTSDPAAAIPVAVTVDTNGGGRINKVELYIDGSLLTDKTTGNVTGVATALPYAYTWQPTMAGVYQLVALAYDDRNNIVASVPTTITIVAPPTVVITSPTNLSTVAGGSARQATVAVDTSGGYPVNVQLFLDDKYVGETTIAAAGSLGGISFTPVQKKTSDGVVLPSKLYAIATDNFGFTGQSPSLTLNITDGGSSGGSTYIGQPPTVSISVPVASTTFPIGAAVPLSAIAADTDGNIVQVVFQINGQIVSTLTSYPYNTDEWKPANLGVYTITAKATDNDGNTVTSSPVTVSITDSGPSGTQVAITAPAANAALTAGAPVTVSADATDDVSVSSVEFFVNGQPLAGGTLTASPYNAQWTPATPGTYTLVARATDNVGNQATSTAVVVTVNPNAPPTVALTSPAAATTLDNGASLNLSATASDTDGTVTSVIFLANNIQIASASAAPFTASWLPSAAGTYSIIARATDDSGNITDTSPVTVTVLPNQAPTVSIVAPTTGVTFRVGGSATITASASDPDGTVTGVQFFANGVQIGSDNATPFSIQWTPDAEGVYNLTAIATDNAGATTTAATVSVVASATSLDAVSSGIYLDLAANASGNYTAINLHGRSASLIGYVPAGPTSGPAKTYFFNNVPVDANGHFELDDAGAVLISGLFTTSGSSGTFLDGSNSITFSGPDTYAQSNSPAAVGVYNGSITGHFSSVLYGIVGNDGQITLYIQDGAFVDAGAGGLGTNGAFTITTRAGNTFAGTASPATHLLTGTLTKADGSSGGSFTGAQDSGTIFSDGTLRNISSRGLVGTGDNILIAGFVVNGTTPKHILIRALGPTLTGLGVTGALADPSLQLFHITTKGTTMVAANDNWGTIGATINTLSAQVGASLALPNGSLDAALDVTLNPGLYTANVSGNGGGTGVALVELYDVDTVPAYSTEKMVNISTRGQVGTGDGILIAGFVVNGATPKQVLVRGVGPTLTSQGVAGALADPVLRIVRLDKSVVRENDNWEVGNDVNLVIDAAAKIGAFPLPSGSKDAAILMNLPPGVYTAQLSGNGGSTGVGMIEVYEVQ